MQHGGHQRSFVFAIAIAVDKNLRRWMGLPTAYTELDGHVTNVALHKLTHGHAFYRGASFFAAV